jgi:hypothetical protein
MATKKTTAPASATKAPAKKAAPKKTAAKKTAAAPRHPLARLKAQHGTKADLVAKIAGPLTPSGADADAVKARLLRASNSQLLHLADVVATVTKKFGSRDKLVDAIGAGRGQGKDKDFLAKLATMPLPQLLDLGNRAARK